MTWCFPVAHSYHDIPNTCYRRVKQFGLFDTSAQEKCEILSQLLQELIIVLVVGDSITDTATIIPVKMSLHGSEPGKSASSLEQI